MIEISWETYEARLTQKGNSDNERTIQYQKEFIYKHMPKSPSYKEVFCKGRKIGMQIVSGKTLNEKNFTAFSNFDIAVGDYLLWDNIFWLVTNIDPDRDVVIRGEIAKCNKEIKWQNYKTKEIVSRWVVASKTYSSNLDVGQIITTSNREYKILLPLDDEAIQVNIGKRFLLEKIDGEAKSYSLEAVDTITNYDPTTKTGVLVWTLTQDQRSNTNDNDELMIADYLPYDTDEAPPLSSKCYIDGPDTIRAGGTPKIYIPYFYALRNNTINTQATPVWEIVADDETKELIMTEMIGNNIKICIPNVKAVGRNFQLVLKDTDGLYTPTALNIKVVSIYG